jgi:hypothetical protein
MYQKFKINYVMATGKLKSNTRGNGKGVSELVLEM